MLSWVGIVLGWNKKGSHSLKPSPVAVTALGFKPKTF